MTDSLTAVLTYVGNNAVAIVKVIFLSKALCNQHNVTYNRGVFFCQHINALNMFLGDYENMNRRHGVDVLECKHLFVLVNL